MSHARNAIYIPPARVLDGVYLESSVCNTVAVHAQHTYVKLHLGPCQKHAINIVIGVGSTGAKYVNVSLIPGVILDMYVLSDVYPYREQPTN